VSLIDRLIEPTKDYISFRDFICHLSGLNNQPVYEVATYLLHHDLSDKDFYYIDTDYKIIKADFNDKSIEYFLTKIQMSVIWGADDWIFHNGKSLEQLSDDVRIKITELCFNEMHSFFKKSELLNFKPLEGLLHFDDKTLADADDYSDSLEHASEKIDKLMRSLSDSDFLIGTLTLGHNEQLAAANDKIKQQEEDINRLNEQLNKKANTSDILSDRTEKSYQTTIGLLLELMTVPKVEGDRPPFTSEAVIIGRIADKLIYGQGKTTLETRFRDVKTTLEQVKKKAFKP
jgi:hypothetical protein